MHKETQIRRVPRFRIRDVTGAITTPQEAEVLDLSLGGALVEHKGMLHVGDLCFLDLPTSGGFFTLRCRVVHIRVSRLEPDGFVYYRTGVEFLNVAAEHEQPLGALIRAYGAPEGNDWKCGGL